MDAVDAARVVSGDYESAKWASIVGPLPGQVDPGYTYEMAVTVPVVIPVTIPAGSVTGPITIGD